MALEDIERLKDKLEKDPNSKLFVPLAEEYKKAGMIDEAIDILTRGLEMQPNYLSARVSLGKIFIEKGMLGEAKSEFEQVIASIPDNLYAHKKLAEIYRDLGETSHAIQEFKTVLKLNPMDEWAVSVLSALEEEQKVSAHTSSVGEVAGISASEDESGKEAPFKITLEETDEAVSHIFSGSNEQTEEEEEPSEIPTSEEAGEGLIEELTEENETAPGTSISEEDMELWKTHLEAIDEIERAEEMGAGEEGTPEEAWELPSEAISEAEEPGESVTGAVEIREDAPLSFEDILEEADIGGHGQEALAGAEPVSEEADARQTAADADRLIKQGEYREAMKIYKAILSADPYNKGILQRTEELKMLFRLLGRDKEELILRLEGFMEGIRKRRDEFFGSP